MTDIGDGYWATTGEVRTGDTPLTLNYKFTLGDWSGTHEDGLTGEGISGGTDRL